MSDNNKKSTTETKKPETLEERIMESAIKRIEKETADATSRRMAEGQDPRKNMPKSLKRWVGICWGAGAIFILSSVAFIVFGLLTGEITLREIFLG